MADRLLKLMAWLLASLLVIGTWWCTRPRQGTDAPAPQAIDSRLVVEVKALELLSTVNDKAEGRWCALDERRGKVIVRAVDDEHKDRFLAEMGMTRGGDSLAVKVTAPGMQWRDGDKPSLTLPVDNGLVSVPVWLLVKWMEQGYIPVEEKNNAARARR